MGAELTWEDEQDINDYLAWQIDNDWATKEHTIMPTTMTKETTVYTLAELEALSWTVYEKAISNVLQWEWECWEPSRCTEDMATVIETEFSLFEPDKHSYRTMSGKTGYSPDIEWSTNPNRIKCSGSVNVASFMRSHKLCNKYRLLWEGIKAFASSATLDVAVEFDGNCSLDDLMGDLEYSDDYHDKELARLQTQATSLEDEIDSYVGEIQSRLLSNLSAEMDWRSSDEFAKEEIEVHELVFTAEGRIYHG